MYNSECNEATIPIVVISYNNYKHVENMVRQLLTLWPDVHIFVIDNASTCTHTQRTLMAFEIKSATANASGTLHNVHVVRMPKNMGHRVFQMECIQDRLPRLYAVTDPDLKLNSNFPTNALHTMAEILREFGVRKVGVALSISTTSSEGGLYTGNYIAGQSIQEWEGNFWEKRLTSQSDTDLELYDAPVDTTLAVYDKTFASATKCIRMAGDFTCIHLPWYPEYNHANFTLEDVTTMYSLKHLSPKEICELYGVECPPPGTHFEIQGTAKLIISDPFYKHGG